MAVVYSTTVKNARMTVTRDAIDGGSGPGKLKLYDAGSLNLLAEIQLADPCGTVSGDILSFSGMPKNADAIATGTAAEAKFTDSADVVVASGLTVGTTGSDVLLNSTTITIGVDVSITSASITHG